MTAIFRGGYVAGGVWLSALITAAETARRRAFLFFSGNRKHPYRTVPARRR